ncbi:MAG: hypothetical protein M1820_005421 [Bogoriella megaspora]|nr:MAG: hypothetical protein M1820_005421 [Bogoriella megaspora]
MLPQSVKSLYLGSGTEGSLRHRVILKLAQMLVPGIAGSAYDHIKAVWGHKAIHDNKFDQIHALVVAKFGPCGGVDQLKADFAISAAKISDIYSKPNLEVVVFFIKAAICIMVSKFIHMLCNWMKETMLEN